MLISYSSSFSSIHPTKASNNKSLKNHFNIEAKQFEEEEFKILCLIREKQFVDNILEKQKQT